MKFEKTPMLPQIDLKLVKFLDVFLDAEQVRKIESV